MHYTHIAIAPPGFTPDQLQQRAGWNQFSLVGEIHTDQTSVLVFASEQPIGLLTSSSLLQAAPELWQLYANCDGSPRQRSSHL